MSDQAKGAGHHAITLEATSRLFRQPGHHGKILGLTEDKFYEKLDHWQAYADRSPFGRTIEHTPFGIGDTWLQANWDPGAQRKHSIADPHKSGAENLKDIQNFIIGQFELAKGYHLEGNHEMEWQCLGAAVHALEDSYSSAHAFRDSLNPTDPYSSIQAFNVFYLLNSTHEGTFDKVPVTNENLERGSDQAAAIAVAIIMGLYVDHINDQADTTNQLFTNEVTALLHGENIQVFSDNTDPEYLAQREAHYQNELSIDPNSITHHPEADSSFPDNSQQTYSIDANMSLPDGATVHHGADSNQTDSQQAHSTDANMSLPDGVTVYHGDSIQTDSQQNYSTDPNMSLPDGATVHHGADSIQTDSQQNYSTNPNMSLPDGATVHHGADSIQTDSQQNYSPADPNTSLPDGTTVHHGADSNQIDFSSITEFASSKWFDPYHHAPIVNHVNPFNLPVHHGVDSNQIDSFQHTQSPDANMSLPDGAAVHHGADSNQTDSSQHTNSTDANMSLPDGATVHHGADSNQIDHSQQTHSTDANMSLPDGTTVRHGADYNQIDHSQQTHSTDANMSLPDGATLHHGADSNQIDHSQQTHSTDSNMSLPDGATIHHGADSNQIDHSQQIHSTDHSSSNQIDIHQNQIGQHVAHDDSSQSMHP